MFTHLLNVPFLVPIPAMLAFSKAGRSERKCDRIGQRTRKRNGAKILASKHFGFSLLSSLQHSNCVTSDVTASSSSDFEEHNGRERTGASATAKTFLSDKR